MQMSASADSNRIASRVVPRVIPNPAIRKPASHFAAAPKPASQLAVPEQVPVDEYHDVPDPNVEVFFLL
jgi:hypothetical protein